MHDRLYYTNMTVCHHQQMYVVPHFHKVHCICVTVFVCMQWLTHFMSEYCKRWYSMDNPQSELWVIQCCFWFLSFNQTSSFCHLMVTRICKLSLPCWFVWHTKHNFSRLFLLFLHLSKEPCWSVTNYVIKGCIASGYFSGFYSRHSSAFLRILIISFY